MLNNLRCVSTADVNSVFLLSIFLIAIGYFIKRIGLIPEKDGKILTNLVMNLTLPALIIKSVSVIEINETLALLPFICIVFSLIITCFSLTVFRKEPHEIKGIFAMTTIGMNIGLFAYPIIEGIWGAEGLKYIAMFDVGNAFIIFGLSYILGSIYSPLNVDKESKVDGKFIIFKLLKSLPLMSYIVALLLNFLTVNIQEESLILYNILDTLASANKGLVLLILGIYLNFNFEKSQWGQVFKVLLIRYGFGIGIGLLLFYTLPFDLLFRGMIIIGMILPIGMAVIPFSVMLKYNEKLVGTMVNLSIIFSFGLMWVLILALGL